MKGDNSQNETFFVSIMGGGCKTKGDGMTFSDAVLSGKQAVDVAVQWLKNTSFIAGRTLVDFCRNRCKAKQEHQDTLSPPLARSL